MLIWAQCFPAWFCCYYLSLRSNLRVLDMTEQHIFVHVPANDQIGGLGILIFLGGSTRVGIVGR
uniref:Uncharacterized protein n=1 Tax=Arundo donax TaxID=35708 RepID=A0A0A9DRD3_ARUDO